MTDTRTEIVKLLGANADMVSENLSTIWSATAADMVAAGVERRGVIDSMFAVAIALKLTTEQPHEIISELQSLISLRH